METIRNSEIMNRQWQNYQKDFDYAAGIEFREPAMRLFVSWKVYRYYKRQIELKRKKIAISFAYILCRM